MSQPKINSFFNSNLGRKSGYNGAEPNMAMNSSRKAMYWNTYKSSNQTLQMYQSKRKEQRAKKMNDQMMFNLSSELSTPPSDSQMMDDSQNFPSTSSQSQESCGWNPRTTSLKPFRNTNMGRGRSGFFGMDSTESKPDFRQYMEEAERVAKEKEDREMLQNFLLSAKQCCEEANLMATELKEQQTQNMETLIAKFQKLAEDFSMQKLLDNNNTQIERLDKSLQNCLDQIDNLRNKFEEQKMFLQESEAKVVSAVQACWQQDIDGIKDCLNKKKPFCTEISTQYSPKQKTCSKASQTFLNYTAHSPDHQVPSVRLVENDALPCERKSARGKVTQGAYKKQGVKNYCSPYSETGEINVVKKPARKPKRKKVVQSSPPVHQLSNTDTDQRQPRCRTGNKTRSGKTSDEDNQMVAFSPFNSPGLVMMPSKKMAFDENDNYFFNWFQADETEISLI